MKRPGLGVVVGRFQVHELHAGHRALIDEADKHQRLLVYVGISPYLVTPSDPLDFAARERMIKDAYPHAVVTGLADQPLNDALWSSTIDSLSHAIFPLDKPTIYFGRGSSRAAYSGKASVVEIDEVPHTSATDIRKIVGKNVENSSSFRAGVIYAAHNQWPRAVPAVDIAVTRITEAGGLFVLLGQRKAEGGIYRFPGGHVDIRDKNYEAAVLREAAEETGGNLEFSSPTYLGSYRAKAGSNWTMFTSFFHVEALFGTASGADDLDNVSWIHVSKLRELKYADAHAELASDLFDYLQEAYSSAQLDGAETPYPS